MRNRTEVSPCTFQLTTSHRGRLHHMVCYEVCVYFDCAEPTARMLRASLAEDESHLHGRLSQVKFDNTSVC